MPRRWAQSLQPPLHRDRRHQHHHQHYQLSRDPVTVSVFRHTDIRWTTQLAPTARDVARHHRRWNTGSTAQLALYRHDWKFSVPPKHLLCSTRSTVLGTSVALTRRALWRLGAHAINNNNNNSTITSSSSSSSSRICAWRNAAPAAPPAVVTAQWRSQRCDTMWDAILTCARKPTWITLIYRTETTTKNCKTEKLKSKNGYAQK